MSLLRPKCIISNIKLYREMRLAAGRSLNTLEELPERKKGGQDGCAEERKGGNGNSLQWSGVTGSNERLNVALVSCRYTVLIMCRRL